MYKNVNVILLMNNIKNGLNLLDWYKFSDAIVNIINLINILL
jgi:hypothetical protein